MITGIESKYHKDGEYRTWKLKCCKASTQRCSRVNELKSLNTQIKGEMDLALPRYYVPYKLDASGRSNNDYIFKVGVMEVAKCEAVKMTVSTKPDVVKKSRKTIGVATSVNCDPTRTIEAELGAFSELEQGFELTTSKTLAHSFAATMSVEMEVEAGITAGASASVSMGGGGSSTEGQTVGNFQTVSSSAIEFFSYEGPAISFVMGEIDEYDYKNDTLGVHYTVKCGATPSTSATTTFVKDTIKLKTTNYGRSHFTNATTTFVKDTIKLKTTNYG